MDIEAWKQKLDDGVSENGAPVFSVTAF